MWNVLNGTVHKHVYTVNKQVLVKRRNRFTNNSKERRSETHVTDAIVVSWVQDGAGVDRDLRSWVATRASRTPQPLQHARADAGQWWALVYARNSCGGTRTRHDGRPPASIINDRRLRRSLTHGDDGSSRGRTSPSSACRNGSIDRRQDGRRRALWVVIVLIGSLPMARRATWSSSSCVRWKMYRVGQKSKLLYCDRYFKG